MKLFLEQLYQIQLLREAIGSSGVAVMNWISQNLLPLMGIIPLYIYWCCDKKAGYNMAFAVSIGSLVNQLLKLTFCVERPWLLDSRIVPPDIALQNQGGYSFPSGHAMLAAGYLIGAAIWLRKKNRLLSVTCWIATVLISFSRIYLGVHTLLDVLAGVGEALILLLVFHRLLFWFWQNKKRTVLFCVFLLLFALLSAVYFVIKPYPLHYDEFGNLLTDPKTMISFAGVGATFGFALGMFVEQYFVNFTTAVPAKTKICRLIIGMLFYLVLYAFCSKWMSGFLGGGWGAYCFNLLSWFFTLAVYPYFFQKIKILGAGYEKNIIK